jgi:hypothetical protein
MIMKKPRESGENSEKCSSQSSLLKSLDAKKEAVLPFVQRTNFGKFSPFSHHEVSHDSSTRLQHQGSSQAA